MEDTALLTSHSLHMRFALAAALALLAPLSSDAICGAAPKADRLDRMTTASIEPTPASVLAVPPALVDAASREMLRRGLDALAAGDMTEARAARDLLARGSLDREAMIWAIANHSDGRASSAEIAEAAKVLRGWPGLERLRLAGERALYWEKAAPQTVVEAFGAAPPETVQGVIALTRANLALGAEDKARQVLVPFWRRAKLGAADERLILKEFAGLLSQADHRYRMERMLYAERVSSAERIAAQAGAKELQKAWAAVLRRDKRAEKLLAAVPAAQRSAGYLFAEAQLLRRKGNFKKAAAAMAKAPTDPESLVDPDAWWIERRVLSRELMDAGDWQVAYRVAASHAAENPSNAVDAEFHAGWYALRGLGDVKAAARHFTRIAEIADGPISLARANYWLGRAAEAGGPGDAAAYFEKAAGYGTAFYGQLAAQRIGRQAIDVAAPEPSAADRATFAGRAAVRAIDRLEQAGHPQLAERLYRDLAEELKSPGELTLLCEKARQRKDHFLALRIAKAAARRGLDIGSLAHPVGVIPASAEIDGAGEALAYAVARQESEFNVAAVSNAGARGLLQLMPGTAKEVARQAGLPYSPARLTTDAGYNATLGAAFLSRQLSRFDGSYILTFAGYNAGPSRAVQWMKRYGDPRGKDIDEVVDWIERIPFTETRSYVQRVMENYQVYKMRLTGRFDIVDDLVKGRG